MRLKEHYRYHSAVPCATLNIYHKKKSFQKLQIMSCSARLYGGQETVEEPEKVVLALQ